VRSELHSFLGVILLLWNCFQTGMTAIIFSIEQFGDLNVVVAGLMLGFGMWYTMNFAGHWMDPRSTEEQLGG
jgi:hypothetical protein